MTSLDNINLNIDVDELVDQLSKTNSGSDLDPKQDQLSTAIQLQILKCLKNVDATMNELKLELVAVKNELSDCKKSALENEQLVASLRAENKHLADKVDDLQTRSRINTLALSGPVVKIEDNSSPAQLLDQSIKYIQDI